MATSNPANVTTSSYEPQNSRYENFENVSTIGGTLSRERASRNSDGCRNNVCAFTSFPVKSNQLYSVRVVKFFFMCFVKCFRLIIFSCTIGLIKRQTVYYIQVIFI